MGQTSRVVQIQHPGEAIPCWVPKSVQNYIDHIEMGVPIRALAREQGCHASTILRQIRRVEMLRDDPLVDGVLKTLGGGETTPNQTATFAQEKPQPSKKISHTLADTDALDGHALRVLRRLCETGAVLAVAAEMEKGVIVRDGQNGHSTRTGVVDRAVAEALALKGWIAAPANGRVTRYLITAAGRSALADMMARNESAQASGAIDPDTGTPQDAPRRIRYSLAESPLAALARRRDRSGERFLDDPLVHAGERLREDFELAQMEAMVTKDWVGFLEGLTTTEVPAPSSSLCGIEQARGRVIAALQDLGPGLSDITLRCCCFLEGLETAEKTLGWSARSGKIVLRIALVRLRRYYTQASLHGGALIG